MSYLAHVAPRGRRRLIALGVVPALALLLSSAVLDSAHASGTKPATPRTYLSALTPAQIAQLSANANEKVIVLLRDQHTEAPTQHAGRAAKLALDENPIVSELKTLHAPKLQAYSFVNAVAATVSSAERARLAADPAVAAVVPDSQVRHNAATAATTSAAPTAAPTPPTGGTPAQACSSNPAAPILEPEALQTMNVDYGPSGPAAAHSLANGAGVKVAVFPDGLDPNIPDFLTAGGSGPSAIYDYQDFTGEGTNGVTGGGESFGDASSIVSQGNQVFDLQGHVNPAHPIPHCYIKIEGVAPAAQLAVMKVFGDTNFAFNSEILQGIDYAVNHDHVDILSESFGGNPVPNPGSDPIAVADQDAVNAGITVVVSSGDAGSTNTIGTPAVLPGVISAGASTNYRLYEQTSSYGAQFGAGWEDDQISGLSSSGVTEANRTIDVLAPGEAGWSDCSTNTATFTECADPYHGPSPQPIEAFGGTSESAPLTAGAAALVIQAYRGSHDGSTPSPALVKQILMSTSRDVHSVAADQGAGLVDALRAVQTAMSTGNPTKVGDGLLYSTNAINAVGATGSTSTTQLTVTNEGATTRTLTPSVRALGAPSILAGSTLTLNQATDPTFTYQNGSTVGDVHLVNFSVPAGTDRVHASIAWNQPASAQFQTIRFDLFDPAGKLAIQSRPQGPVGFSSGGFSQVEVHDPQPGTWTMLTFDTAFAGPDNYSGPLAYSITGQSFVTVPSAVTPTTATIVSGASATFTVKVKTPATPGDTSESLVFGASPAGDVAPATVPITLRSLAKVGTAFSGTITGGNSRMPFYGQEIPYQFDVTSGHKNVDVTLHVADPGYQVLAFLVDPSGTPVDVQSSSLWDGSGTPGQNISLFRQKPVAGRWSLLVVQLNNVDSQLTSSTFTATVKYATVVASEKMLPTTFATHVSGLHVATITVKNTGNQPEAYMVDARRNAQSVLSLSSLVDPNNEPLPINDSSKIPQLLVPPFSPSAVIAASSSVPITLDTSPNFGTPDVEGQSSGNASVALLSAAELPASAYSCAPAEQGPFSGTAPSTTFSCGAEAVTNTFAPDVFTDAGNIWSDLELGTSTYNPLVLNPGQTATIHVKIVPSDPAGTKVSGFLTVETFNFNTLSSDEVAMFPYAYTAG